MINIDPFFNEKQNCWSVPSSIRNQIKNETNETHTDTEIN